MKFAVFVLTAVQGSHYFEDTLHGQLPAGGEHADHNGVHINSWSSSTSFVNVGGKVTKKRFNRAFTQGGGHSTEVRDASRLLTQDGELVKAEAGVTGQSDGNAIADSFKQEGKRKPVTTHQESGKDLGALRQHIREVEARVGKDLASKPALESSAD